ncbi:hypothetical protein HKX48_007468 [Thoreauomyces humboldtii]|nr:hypothetical protein HKX48_007468 [Thoreauomyces humboldtii]
MAIYACLNFAVIAALHIYLMRRFRTVYMWPMVVGALMEVLGYALRLYSRTNVSATGPYAGQQVLIIIAPVFFAAANYVILGRIIASVGPEYSVVPGRWMARIFVALDCFSFLIQSSGSGLLVSAKDDSAVSSATNLLIGGLVIQVVAFSIFILLAAIFHHRARMHSRNGDFWKVLMMALYFSSLCILARSVYRVIEFSQGYDGPIARRESFMYAFDFVFMQFATAAFLLVHPGAKLGPANAVPIGVEESAKGLDAGSDHEMDIARGRVV